MHLNIFIYGLCGAAFVQPQLRAECFLHEQENNIVLQVRQNNWYRCVQISAHGRSLLSRSWVGKRLFTCSRTIRGRVSARADAAPGTDGKGPGESLGARRSRSPNNLLEIVWSVVLSPFCARSAWDLAYFLLLFFKQYS